MKKERSPLPAVDTAGNIRPSIIHDINSRFLEGESLVDLRNEYGLIDYEIPRLHLEMARRFERERDLRYDQTCSELMAVLNKVSRRAATVAAADAITTEQAKELDAIQQLVARYTERLAEVELQRREWKESSKGNTPGPKPSGPTPKTADEVVRGLGPDDI